ncbi:MAG: hypothetical protein JST98_04980 [Bacteroidetes bacterium]|nr:hypothetical protein [Bacteroidota bacterium]
MSTSIGQQNDSGSAAHAADEAIDLKTMVAEVADEAKGYWDAQKAHAILTVAEKGGNVMGSLLGLLLSTVAALMFLALFNVAAGLWIGHALGSLALGFSVVAAFYLLVFLILQFWAGHAIRKAFTLYFANAIYHGEED